MNSEFDQNYFLVKAANKAQSICKSIGFPNKKNERWRFNQLNTLAKTQFIPAPKIELTSGEIEPLRFDNMERIVLVNGRYSKDLSDDINKGVHVSSLYDTAAHSPNQIEHILTKIAPNENHYFAAQNTANFPGGILIKTPKNSDSNLNLHILNISAGKQENFINYPRILIMAEENSNLSILEHYSSIDSHSHLTNTVMEIEMDENSQVKITRLQDENLNAHHISMVASSQKKNSRLKLNTITSGGLETINDTENSLQEIGAEIILDGIFLTKGKQKVDNHTLIHHHAEHTISNETYTGILNDESYGIFDGKIVVDANAQKIESSQTNKNLLLSENARVHSNPQLEINADDVKCSHASTTGQLDDDAMFYLKSRGLSEQRSRQILVEGFANDILENINQDELREFVFQKVSNVMQNGSLK